MYASSSVPFLFVEDSKKRHLVRGVKVGSIERTGTFLLSELPVDVLSVRCLSVVAAGLTDMHHITVKLSDLLGVSISQQVRHPYATQKLANITAMYTFSLLSLFQETERWATVNRLAVADPAPLVSGCYCRNRRELIVFCCFFFLTLWICPPGLLHDPPPHFPYSWDILSWTNLDFLIASYTQITLSFSYLIKTSSMCNCQSGEA